MKGVAVFGFELMLEEELEHFVAFLLRKLVDADRIARIRVQHLALGDRMRKKNRMRHRGLRSALRLGERRALAASIAHPLPELVEVVQHRHSLQAPLEIGGKTVVSGVHAAELGRPERLAVALRDLDAVEHVRERDHPAVRHVGVPVLPRVGKADRLAVLDDVGEDHHLRNARLLVGVGDIDLELAEARAEIGELPAGELLAREANNAVSPERAQHGVELLLRQRLREVEPLDRRAERLSAADHFHHRALIDLEPRVLDLFIRLRPAAAGRA